MVQAVRELDRYSKSEIEECSELLQYIYVNDDECFVRVLNKTTGKNKVYPTSSLKDPMKLRQVINSFGFGCFMATLFLYSGKIWIPMIIHALNDFLVFSITPLGTNNAGIFYSEIGQVLKVLIFVFIWIIFAIITFTKNKDIIRNNVQILTRVQKTDLTISRSKL